MHQSTSADHVAMMNKLLQRTWAQSQARSVETVATSKSPRARREIPQTLRKQKRKHHEAQLHLLICLHSTCVATASWEPRLLKRLCRCSCLRAAHLGDMHQCSMSFVFARAALCDVPVTVSALLCRCSNIMTKDHPVQRTSKTKLRHSQSANYSHRRAPRSEFTSLAQSV